VTTLLGQTFAGRIEATYSVFVHSDRSPTASDWSRIVAAVRAVPSVSTIPILVYTDGGAPDAAQRAEILRVFGPTRPRIAILTKSVIARVAAKALSLLATELRVFDINQVDAALSHLRLSESDKVNAQRALMTLKQELAAGAGSSSQRPRPDE
jgi:hypothetical protein